MSVPILIAILAGPNSFFVHNSIPLRYSSYASYRGGRVGVALSSSFENIRNPTINCWMSVIAFIGLLAGHFMIGVVYNTLRATISLTDATTIMLSPGNGL